MSAILRGVPFLAREDELGVGLERIRIRPYQIIVWVSVVPKTILQLGATVSRFPALLDTGRNHNFSIQRQHLLRWVAIDASTVPFAAPSGRDVYGLGVVLRTLLPERPPEVQALCQRCLSSDPQGRHASAAELASSLQELQAALSGR